MTASIDERIQRMRTIQEVFSGGEWLSVEQLAAASEWVSRGQVFCVNYGGKEYFARYQFDAELQPLPIIKNILAAFGEVADTWTLAAWFHFPSPWLVQRDEYGAHNIAPKDALDREADVVHAAALRLGGYVS